MPLRNSVHRRNHKERSQLAHRSRLGILEKHKDYVLRARDYHSKQDRIKRLRQKAAERNKDEFYFSMNRERTKGGIHIQSRGNEALPIDMVKILKTQDENYVRTMRTSNQKKIEKLKQQLTALADLINPGLLNEDEDLDEDDLEVLREAGIVARPANKKKSGKIPKHIIFSTEEEAPTEYSPEEKPLSGDPVDLGWKVEKKKGRKGKARETASSTTEAQTEIEDEQRRTEAEAHRKRLLKELSARLVRDKQLRYAQRELEMQRLLMGKGARRKLSGPQKIDDGNDEDDLDDPRTNRKLQSRTVDPKTYKPREYKWRIERSR